MSSHIRLFLGAFLRQKGDDQVNNVRYIQKAKKNFSTNYFYKKGSLHLSKRFRHYIDVPAQALTDNDSSLLGK